MIEIDLRPDRRRLRQFGLIALVVFGALAGWAWWKGHLLGIELGANATRVAQILGLVAALSGLLAAVWPTGVRPLYVVMTLIAWPIGTVVSYAIMLIIFYLVITPTGLVFRVIGRDALNRKLDPERASYWEDHRTPPDLGRYFRQF